MEPLHEAAKLLRETIEKFSESKNVIVSWAVVSDEDKYASGITIGEKVTSNSMSYMIFNLNGRAYNMIDYDAR